MDFGLKAPHFSLLRRRGPPLRIWRGLGLLVVVYMRIRGQILGGGGTLFVRVLYFAAHLPEVAPCWDFDCGLGREVIVGCRVFYVITCADFARLVDSARGCNYRGSRRAAYYTSYLIEGSEFRYQALMYLRHGFLPKVIGI